MAEPEEELEDELDDERFDGEEAGAGACVSVLVPDSLLAVTFPDSPPGLSLAGLPDSFVWLGSFSLFE